MPEPIAEGTPGTRDAGHARPLRGVVLILLTGAALGLAFNALGRAGTPPRGIAWIAEPVVLTDLESLQKDSSGTHEPPADDAGARGTSGESGAPARPIPSGEATAAESPASSPRRPRFASPDVSDPLALGGAAAESAELPYVPDLGRPIQIQLPAVKKFFDAKGALFVDAREPEEFAVARIPGAVNLPFDTAVTDPVRLEKLDTGGRPIIVYCGGGTCEVSKTLAFSLIQAGHSKVLVYMGGFPEWESSGNAVEKGSAPAESRQ